MRVRVEFTTEPFRGEAGLPGHVRAAAEPFSQAGLEPDLGPLGTSVEGEAEAVVAAIGQALTGALRGGATRITLQLERAADDA